MKHTDIEIDRQLETVAEPVYVPDMTTTVGKLKHLRHVVSLIPPERFDMETTLEVTACGSRGCMIGWAGVDPHFEQLGLKMVGCNGTTNMNWRGEAMLYSEAGSYALGISHVESEKMFTSLPHEGEPRRSEDFTIAHGLARIDRMIEKYSK